MEFAEKRKNGYLFDTEVENIFISEHMVTAPGDYVKVYLYVLMCAQLGQSVSEERLAKLLMMDPAQVERALLYWQERGVLCRSVRNADGGAAFDASGDGALITFVSLREELFGGAGAGGAEAKDGKSGSAGGALRSGDGSGGQNDVLRERRLAEMCRSIEKIIGRPLGGKELMEIYAWTEDFSAAPETIVTAYSYCKKTYHKDSAAYVGKVVKDWALKGLDNVIKIDEYLGEVERNRFLHKRVFKALGFMRNPTEEERRIMNAWFTEMEYPIDQVLEACRKTSGISNPNLNYVNKILTDRYREKHGALPGEERRVTVGTVMKYYDFIRGEAEEAARSRKEEIYTKLPEIREIDEEIRRSGTELSRMMILGRQGKNEAAGEIRQRMNKLLADKAAILTENSYSADYMEPRYRCARCGDTGTTEDGERCGCFAQRMEEAKAWQISEKK